MSEREDEEKSRGFKVDDRRRFSAEGEIRPQFQEQQSPSPAAPEQASAPHPQEPPVPSEPGEDEAEINFTTFVMGFLAEAQMHLGEVPDPISDRIERNLPAARQLIDILGMLQDKTRGNLDRNEEGLLGSILYTLRMKYVEAARQP